MWINPFRKIRRDGNYVIRWAMTQDAGDKRDVPFIDVFLGRFVGYLMLFGDFRDPECKPSKWPKVLGVECPYSEDIGLLELACYRLFLLDVYLFSHHKNHRDAISDLVLEKLLGLFRKALGSALVHDVYNNRVRGYSEIMRYGAEAQRGCEEHLAALMCLAGRGKVEADYEFGEHPMKNMGYNAEDFMHSYIHVTGWIIASTPDFIDLANEYVRRVEEGTA